LLAGGLCLWSRVHGQIGETAAEIRTRFGDVVPERVTGNQITFETDDGTKVVVRFRNKRACQIHVLGVTSEKEALRFLKISHPQWIETGSSFFSTRWMSDDKRVMAFYLFKSKHLVVDLAKAIK
jgi:hypothetical protein